MKNVNVRDNRIIFDWLAFTIHNLDVNEVIMMLGLNDCLGNFQEMKGHDGYKDRLFFNGISIYYNGHENQGIHICFSGQGCRTFESYSEYGDFKSLLSAAISLPKGKISRIDIAYDDFKGLLNLDTIAECVRFGNWTSSSGARWWDVNYSSVGTSAYIGSPQSRIRVRFYDKAAEQKVDYFWSRCELQLRDEQATEFIKQYVYNNMSINELYFGVLNNFVRFIDKSTSSNVSRCKMYEWWEDFIETKNKVKLWTPGITYNIAKLKQNVEERWGNAIQTYLSLFGFNMLQHNLDEIKPVSDLPVQYKKIILDYAHDFRANSRMQEINIDNQTIEIVNDLPKKLERVLYELEDLQQ